MAQRLFRGLGKKSDEPTPPPEPTPAPRPPASATPGTASADETERAEQIRLSLELSREVLRGIENFVLSTPDLDAPSFLDRLRRIAAQLTPAIERAELERHRRWASDSLSAFGQLQRRYLSEREDELWRLLRIYQEHLNIEGNANTEFRQNMEGVHERMGAVVSLDDLRQVRERLQGEIHRAGQLLEQKGRMDDERAAVLSAKVQQLEAQLVTARTEANRDALTGIYHRGGFMEQLISALQSPTPISLAMIDVDNFKGINDTLGHLVGDHILKMAVHLLGKLARPGDVIGRYGGDEFCFFSPGTPVQRLVDRFNGPLMQQNITFTFEDRLCSVRLGMSVGVAGSLPGDTAEALIHRADIALLATKRAGKGHARAAPAAPADSR